MSIEWVAVCFAAGFGAVILCWRVAAGFSPGGTVTPPAKYSPRILGPDARIKGAFLLAGAHQPPIKATVTRLSGLRGVGKPHVAYEDGGYYAYCLWANPIAPIEKAITNSKTSKPEPTAPEALSRLFSENPQLAIRWGVSLES